MRLAALLVTIGGVAVACGGSTDDGVSGAGGAGGLSGSGAQGGNSAASGSSQGGTTGGSGSGQGGTTGGSGSGQGGVAVGGRGGSSGGGRGGASGVSGSSNTGGSGNTAGAGGVGGAATDCDALQREVLVRLEAAKQCCAFCDSIQCTALVSGLCCPETVGNANSLETQAYLQALDRFINANCAWGCTLIACRLEPSMLCEPTSSGGGRCL
jgi:hypothetical protein